MKAHFDLTHFSVANVVVKCRKHFFFKPALDIPFLRSPGFPVKQKTQRCGSELFQELVVDFRSLFQVPLNVLRHFEKFGYLRFGATVSIPRTILEESRIPGQIAKNSTLL